MSRITTLLLASALSAGTLLAPGRAAADPDTAAPEAEAEAILMPELVLETLTGEPVRLADYRGKVVVLNFWTTWCAPCRKEIPGLNALHGEYAERGLAVLGVSPEEPELISKFLEQKQAMDYPSIRLVEDPPAPVDEVYGAFPLTFILGRDGAIQGVLVGARSKDELAERIKPLL